MHFMRPLMLLKVDLIKNMESTQFTSSSSRPRPFKEFVSPLKIRKMTHFSENEKFMVINVFIYVKNTWPADKYQSKLEMKEKTANILGISKASVYRVLKEYVETDTVKPAASPKKRFQVKRKSSGDPGCLACSECGAWVAARVYVCVQCVDARMCAACEPHAHASHAVVRLPSTRVYNIVRDLFESLQEQLNCRLRGLDDDAEDELTDDLDDDELDQYVNPVVKKTKRPVVASSAGQQIMPHEASKVTFKSSPPASPMPTDETNEPMVTADDIKVEDDYDEWEPLRETATEGFMKITSDIVKSECNEGTVAESKLAVDVRGDDKYNEMNLSKCLENESEFKRVSNVTVVRKTKGNTAGINKPAVKLETTENTSIECAQANELGSQIAVKIKEEPTEDACTEQVDSTGFLVIGSPRSIKVEDKETS
ncbi:uncharacterized protein LOC105381188 isoform X9 [Plutella xylostella]|uniref:uncharacterized protein LOC105381188 isoform X9 n=1 Tax=Plutella xylostella TaxID=51655 RepID=UPI002032BDE8|nr:uncharacterized protein LOC105381188 isoform X9 [Plutella xylostella]